MNKNLAGIASRVAATTHGDCGADTVAQRRSNAKTAASTATADTLSVDAR